MKEFIFASCMILILLASGCVSDTVPGTPEACSDGDKVALNDLIKVEYRGTLENGELFDEGELEFNAGAGQMIKGFDEAVMGMCAGGEKDVSIPPEEAYGQASDDLIYVMPLEFSMERYLTISEEQFTADMGSDPVVNETYFKPTVYIMPLLVTEIADGNVTMEKAVTAGFVMNDIEPWPVAVTDVNDTHIELVREVSDGENVVTAYGEKTVTVRDGNAMLDMNHFLAGETLNFHIKILNITKSQ